MTEIPPGLTRDAPASERGELILDLLAEEIPDAEIALRFADNWQLLVATILSAQSTDVQVNKVTGRLFDELPDPTSAAEAPRQRIEELINSLGLFRQKAGYIQGSAERILAEHGGEVPDTMDELTELPGVARKTANVVLSNAFGTDAGVVVDTHVQRLSQRLGLTTNTRPVDIEQDLMRLFPKRRWLEVSDLLIHHGRRTCSARSPACEDCVLEPLCPSSRAAGREDLAGR